MVGINPFVPSTPFLYPLQISESLRFSHVFRRKWKGAFGTNGLRKGIYHQRIFYIASLLLLVNHLYIFETIMSLKHPFGITAKMSYYGEIWKTFWATFLSYHLCSMFAASKLNLMSGFIKRFMCTNWMIFMSTNDPFTNDFALQSDLK